MDIVSFDADHAREYGVVEAIILYRMINYTKYHVANNTHFYDGKFWIFNSMKAWQELLPFLTEGQVRRAIENLVVKEAVETGNYNDTKYDRTMWYTVKPTVYAIWQNKQMDLAKTTNGFGKISRPIPNTTTKDTTNTSLPDGKPDEQEEATSASAVQTILDYWNKTVKTLPKVNRSTSSRDKAIRYLVREFGVDVILNAIDKVEASDFLSGREKWQNCSFDWVLQTRNFVKIIEGNYNKNAKPNTTTSKYRIVTGGGSVEYTDKSMESPLGYFPTDTETTG